MGKMTNYFFITAGVVLLMHYTGLLTEANTLVTNLLSIENFTFSLIWEKIKDSMLAKGAGAVAAVLVISGKPDLAAASVVTLLYANLLYTLLLAYSQVTSISVGAGVLATLFIAPLFIGSIFALFEYWRGITI